MKKAAKHLCLFILLAAVAGLIYGYIRVFAESDLIGRLGMIGALLAAALIGWLYSRRISQTRNKATANTMGVIETVRPTYWGDETDDHYCFVVRYTVGSREYRVKEASFLTSKKQPKQYEQMKVPVHYDPQKPSRAWAETPGGNPHMGSQQQE